MMYHEFEKDLSILLTSDDLSETDTRKRDEMIEMVERLHDRVVRYKGSNSAYASIINDLTFSLSMWLSEHEMDDEDTVKLRKLLYASCAMIGKPRPMEELVAMLGRDMDGNPLRKGDSE